MMRKPKVVILGTGGTIAGKAGSNTEMTGYQAGEIGIQTLINAVPEMLEVADVTGEQFCNIGSFDITSFLSGSFSYDELCVGGSFTPKALERTGSAKQKLT